MQHNYVKKHYFGWEFWNFSEKLDPKHYLGFLIQKPIPSKNNLIIFISYKLGGMLSQDAYIVGIYGDAEILEHEIRLTKNYPLEEALVANLYHLPPDVYKELLNIEFNVKADKSLSCLLPVKIKFDWKKYNLPLLKQAFLSRIDKNLAKVIIEDIKKCLLVKCRNNSVIAYIDPSVLYILDAILENINKGFYQSS